MAAPLIPKGALISPGISEVGANAFPLFISEIALSLSAIEYSTADTLTSWEFKLGKAFCISVSKVLSFELEIVE